VKAAQRAKKLVLVVDDFADNREMYAEYLRFKGYDVAEAATGQEAIDLTTRLQPDLVCMDLSLPGVDGWEATRRIKADDRTRHIPVVVVTGHALEQDNESAVAAGGDVFLTKPCLPENLVTAVERVLALSSRHSEEG
jgi:CheY-like chemotaxis protein